LINPYLSIESYQVQVRISAGHKVSTINFGNTNVDPYIVSILLATNRLWSASVTVPKVALPDTARDSRIDFWWLLMRLPSQYLLGIWSKSSVLKKVVL
jgi:hypothetical protein